MYKLAVKESLDRKLKKFKKKDREMFMLIDRKVRQILDNPPIQALKEALAK